MISPLCVRPFVRSSRIDLGNRTKDFPETWHEVGEDKKRKNITKPFFEKNSHFAQFLAKCAKNGHFSQKIAVFETLRKKRLQQIF